MSCLSYTNQCAVTQDEWQKQFQCLIDVLKPMSNHDSEYWEDQANQAREESMDWQEKYEALRTDYEALMEGITEIEKALAGIKASLAEERARLSQDQGQIAQPSTGGSCS